jgi:hypothetical protein
MPSRQLKIGTRNAILAGFLGAALLAGVALADGTDEAAVIDLRVGENASAGRLIVVCDGPCMAEEVDGGFHLFGVNDDMMVDLSGRGGFFRTLSIMPESTGSFLVVETAQMPAGVAVVDCGVGTEICIDFLKPIAVSAAPQLRDEMADTDGSKISGLETSKPKIEPPIAKAPPVRLEMAASTPLSQKPKPQKPVQATKPEPVKVPQVRVEEKPAKKPEIKARPRLRVDGVKPDAGDRFAALASLPAPKAMSRPITKIPDSNITPASDPTQALRMTMNAEAVSFLAGRTGLAITPNNCAKAQSRLQADAWDLTAYRRFSLCIAAAGHYEQAFGLLTRLEKYQPGDEATLEAKQAILELAQKGQAGPGLVQESSSKPSLR